MEISLDNHQRPHLADIGPFVPGTVFVVLLRIRGDVVLVLLFPSSVFA